MSKRTPAPPLATGYATGLIRQRRWRGTPAAAALSYLRRRLRPVLGQSGLLGVRTLRSRSFRDCAYVVCTSFKARFGFYQPAIWTRTETTRRVGDALVDALETVAAATLEAVLVHLQPTRPKVLACVQLTTMDAGVTRGAHYDKAPSTATLSSPSPSKAPASSSSTRAPGAAVAVLQPRAPGTRSTGTG